MSGWDQEYDIDSVLKAMDDLTGAADRDDLLGMDHLVTRVLIDHDPKSKRNSGGCHLCGTRDECDAFMVAADLRVLLDAVASAIAILGDQT